jgi:hypothetical protein
MGLPDQRRALDGYAAPPVVHRPARDLPAPRVASAGGRLAALAAAGEVLAAFANGTLEVPTASHDVATPGEPAVERLREEDEHQHRLPALPHHIVFPQRTTARTLTGVLLLPVLAGTGVAAWRASHGPTATAVALAVGLAVASLVLAVARARTGAARLSVTGSRLEILRAGTRMVFDLADPDTAVEIVGTPGRRGWRVVFQRRVLAPAVVDASMVDPRAFTPVVEFHRARAEATRR